MSSSPNARTASARMLSSSFAPFFRQAAGEVVEQVFHSFEGYGIHLHIHHDEPSRLRIHGPCAVVLIDTADRLRTFLDTQEDILSVNGAAVLDGVTGYRPEAGLTPA
ncbi:DUF190 domain-containing protein [Streptomyces sp. KM273126]|uniref:DUF190 domain-containing protein n=1 Tax=Streptomyces sp. KM273126 TaxID=2545247 RepID=UPI001404DEF3|nr:DUF190 domain-containing protein [Streptomyces sp. KM273126]MBA2806908.1 DUF190 domain-containing protein [Streptomyces sp. KM273126]